MTKLMVLCTAPDERLEVVLKEAEALGFACVFCDEIPHEEMQSKNCTCYTVDLNDREKLLDIARKEQVSGVVGLCDKFMLCAARLAQDLGLPGNPPESIEVLLSKYDFRELQQRVGVFCPRHVIVDCMGTLRKQCSSLNFPVIVKPLLSSSSYGQTVLQNATDLPAAVKVAAHYSRNSRVCVEEYIALDSLRAVEMDIFVAGEDILWDGIRDSYRVAKAPLRPLYDVYPAHLTEAEHEEIRRTVRAVLKVAGVRLGEYNIEGFFAPDGRFFILEINPRQAGYYNPQHIQMYCGVNLTKLLLTTAVRDWRYYDALKTFPRTRKNILAYSVFADRAGIFAHLHVDVSVRQYVIARQFMHGQKEGDFVKDILTAVRPICIVVMEFPTEQELEAVRRHIEELIYAVIR